MFYSVIIFAQIRLLGVY